MRRSLRIVAIWLCIATPAFLCISETQNGSRIPWDEVESLFQQAVKLHEEGWFVRAIALYEQALGVLCESVDPHPKGVIPDSLSFSVKAIILHNLSVCYEALIHWSGDGLIHCWRPSPQHLEGLGTLLPADPVILSSSSYACAEEVAVLRLFARAVNAEYGGRLLDARQLYREALGLYGELGTQVSQADCLWALGNCHFALLEYDRAIECYQGALGIAGENGYFDCLVGCLANLGNCYYSMCDYHLAMDCHRQALSGLVDADQEAEEEKAIRKLHLCYQALSMDCWGAHQEILAATGRWSIEMPRERCIYRREENSTSAEELAGLRFSRLARAAQEDARFRDAIEFHEQALSIYRELANETAVRIYPTLKQNIDAAIANCLLGLGNCHSELYEYGTAIALYKQSLKLARKVDAQWLQAACLGNLANSYDSLGNYARAISLHEQVLLLFREINDRTDVELKYMDGHSDRSDEFSELMNLGYSHLALGNYVLARDYFVQSLTYFEGLRAKAFDDLRRADPDLIALSPSKVLGEEYESRRRYMECLPPVVTSLANLGAACYAASQYAHAIDYFMRSLELSLDIGDRLGESNGYLGLGSCNRALGNHLQALEFYQQALSLAEETGIRGLALPAHWGLGRTCKAMEQSEAALAYYEEAISIAESIRGNVSEENLRRSYLGSVRTLYEEYLELLAETGRSQETFLAAERTRARTLLDLVSAGPVGTLENVAAEGIRTGVVEASAIEADLAQVIATLPPDAAAVEYFVTDETTYAWVIRDNSTSEPMQIGVSKSELRELILGFRTAIETSTTGLSDLPDEATLTMSRDLYDLLITPVENQLDGIEHLVLVPSGPLYYLPFCALLDCPGCEGADFLGGKYLVERCTLSYIPSLTTLKYAWVSSDAVHGDPLLLALADPDSGDPRFARLISMQREAIAVAGLFDPSEVHVAAAATEEVVTARAGSADQLLLSTHGTFNPLNPIFSYLLLSPTEESDGRLYTHEIFALDLHTDLVTLSACETLLPALRDMENDVRAVRGIPAEQDVELTEELLASLTAGDEIVGLTRAFLYAGTPSVLSSLWQVVSETTEPLMVAFYGYLQQGFDKAEALRQAQLDVMASYPHPRYWAAFELVGDWR